MPVYVWKGMDRQGKRQSGEIEADNPTIARQFVIRKGITYPASRPSPRICSNISLSLRQESQKGNWWYLCGNLPP